MTKQDIQEAVHDISERLLELAKLANDGDLQTIAATLQGSNSSRQHLEDFADMCSGFCNAKITERQMAEN